MTKKPIGKKGVLALFITVLAVALAIVILKVIAGITGLFVLDCISYAILQLCYIPFIVFIIRKAFRDMVTDSLKPATIMCAISLAFEAVLSTARYVLSGGDSPLLFVPIALPLCYIAISYYAYKDTGKKVTQIKCPIIILGIILFLVASAFEIYSFVDILL